MKTPLHSRKHLFWYVWAAMTLAVATKQQQVASAVLEVGNSKIKDLQI